MSRFLSLAFALLVALSSFSPAFAQTPPSIVPGPSMLDVAASGPLNCFDFYTFGSVQADLVPGVAQTVPGALLTFTGEVKSTNPYPLLDGTLYVKIFHRNEKTFAEGDGNDVVDQFIIKEGMTIPTQGSAPVQYEWKVPVNAEGGEYYAAYFFTTAKRYNLMGLSFTDDVVGNQAPFTVTALKDSSEVAKLSKISTTLNGKDHHFAAFPLHFAAGDTVTVKTTITNPTQEAKTMPLQWNQYAWDAMNKDNIRFTKTELVTLKPNETKEVSYEVQAQRESVVYVTAVTQDLEAKSILNIRYVRDGIEETRINFPGVTKFPLQKDSNETLFACAHSTNQPVVSGNILTLTLKDRDGSTIHKYKYEGDIVGAMSGFGDTFTPSKNINYATLTTTLERNGVIVEQVTQTYDCTQIDPNSCLPEERSAASIFDYLKNNFMIIILTGVVVLMLAAISVFFIKKRRSSSDTSGGTPMTTPLSLLFFLLLLPTMFFMQPGVGEAKSVTWNTSSLPTLFYCWNGNEPASNPSVDIQDPVCNTIFISYTNTHINWSKALDSIIANVTYSATITELNTGTLINDGSSVSVGTNIVLKTLQHTSTDISWFGTGYAQDSPNGEWRLNADPPDWVYQSYYDPMTSGNKVRKGPTINNKDFTNSVYIPPGGLFTIGYYIDNYFPLVIAPPLLKTTTVGANLSCSAATVDSGGTLTQNCIVTSPGALALTFNVPATYGKFYHRYLNFDGPRGNQTALRVATSYDSTGAKSVAASNYLVQVPQQTITFNLTAAPAVNQPPAPPTITGPTTGLPNTAYTFNLTTTDPDNNTLRYGIDWDNNGSVDAWVPGTGYVNSGTSQSANRSWATTGSYTFRALAQDSNGASSGWVNHSITISAPASNDCIVPNTQDDQIIDECALSTSGGYRIGQDFDYAFAINLDGGGNLYRVCHNNQMIAQGICSVGEFIWDGDPSCQGSFPACTPTVTTADLKINNSDGLVSVPKNTSVNLTWTSANAVSCTKWGGAWGSGEGIALNGSDTTVVAASGTYMINCGGFIDSVDVVVVNQAPNPPTITGTCTQAGVNNTFTITGTDPDNDNIFYEVDWNNDGTVDATTMTVTSGQSQPATYSWPTAGLYTFQARTVDAPPGGLRSAWTAHNVICPVVAASAPTADINIRVNGADWDNDSPANIFPGDFIYVNWSSTNATNCTATGGSGFGTSNAVSGTDNDVTEPAPGTSDTFIVSCTGPGGTTQSSFVVNTYQKPNFNKPLVSIRSLGTFDPVTATYASVNVSFSTVNNGGSITKSSAPYLVEITGYPTQSGTIPTALAVGPSGYSNTITIPGPISFGTEDIKVSIDTPISSNGSVDESIEGVADNTNSISLAIPPPDPGLSITADRTRLRNGESTIIRWNIATPYTGLACEVHGPGISINPAAFSDDEPTQPISAKSEYTLKCTVAGTTFQKSVFVETEGEIEEI